MTPHWTRIHHRAHHADLQGEHHISKQRKLALWMTAFAAFRTIIWIIFMGLIIAHWAGVGGSFLHSVISLSASIVFVTFISLYCNAATDAGAFVAGIAALFSADSHYDAEATRHAVSADFIAIEADIARLAELQPGPEASALADEIRRKLKADERKVV